jgi:hypothetical protein
MRVASILKYFAKLRKTPESIAFFYPYKPFCLNPYYTPFNLYLYLLSHFGSCFLNTLNEILPVSVIFSYSPVLAPAVRLEPAPTAIAPALIHSLTVVNVNAA